MNRFKFISNYKKPKYELNKNELELLARRASLKKENKMALLALCEILKKANYNDKEIDYIISE